MAYCRNCGAEISDTAAVCPCCGAAAGPQISDTGSIGWAFLGFLLPVVGLILYLVWQDSHPANSRMAGIGALAAVVLPVGLGVLAFLSTALLAFLR